MTLDMRFKLFVLAACICQVLAVTHLAQGQSASDPVQKETGTYAAQQSQTTSANPTGNEKPQKVGREGAYGNFLYLEGLGEMYRQARSLAGQDVLDREDYSKGLDLREDENNDVWRIILDAYQKIVANDKKLATVPPQTDDNPSPDVDTRIRKVTLDWHQTQVAIIKAAIAQFQQSLGEDHFKIFDAYVYSHEGGGQTWLPADSPNRRKPAVASTQ